MAVVFTDNFTVASNANLDAHPSGSPDYAYVQGSGANLVVSAADDRVVPAASAAVFSARIIDAAVPTGDQEITATCHTAAGTYRSAFVLVRMASGSADYYNSYVNLLEANEVAIGRTDNGVATTLASVDRGLSGTLTLPHRLKVTGTGATVSLELQVGATAVVTYDDSHVNRKTSGSPGIGAYSEAAGESWVDDVSVDDLVVAPVYRGATARFGVVEPTPDPPGDFILYPVIAGVRG